MPPWDEHIRRRLATLASAGLLLTCGLACGMSGPIGDPEGAPQELTEARPADEEILDFLNETCPDVWCEGEYSYWFHSVRCVEERCTVGFTASITDQSWGRLGFALPARQLEAPMERDWRANGPPTLDRLTYPDLPRVLVDATLELGRPQNEDDMYGGDWEQSIGPALDAWRPTETMTAEW